MNYIDQLDEVFKLQEYFKINPEEGSIKFLPNKEYVFSEEPMSYNIEIEIKTTNKLSQYAKDLITKCEIKSFTCKI